MYSVSGGQAPGDNPAKSMRTSTPLVNAGLAWWIEAPAQWRSSFDTLHAHIRREAPQR